MSNDYSKKNNVQRENVFKRSKIGWHLAWEQTVFSHHGNATCGLATGFGKKL